MKMACRCGHQLRNHDWGTKPQPCERCHCKDYIEYDNDLDECPHCGDKYSSLYIYKGVPFTWCCSECKTIWILKEKQVIFNGIVRIDILKEKLAALEHEQWSRWFQVQNTVENEYYGGLKESRKDQVLESSIKIDNWSRQSNTSYLELSEHEKDSDREWADKVIELLKEMNVIA